MGVSLMDTMENTVAKVINGHSKCYNAIVNGQNARNLNENLLKKKFTGI